MPLKYYTLFKLLTKTKTKDYKKSSKNVGSSQKAFGECQQKFCFREHTTTLPEALGNLLSG